MKNRIRGRHILAAAAAVAVLYFAVQGGEYGTAALVRQRGERSRALAKIDQLKREIDSLTRVKKAVTTDPVTQERIAREEFGMVRGPKEVLYRFAEPADSASLRSDSARRSSGPTRP
ncbi:MAG: septum formation initiator family protein [Gemmatimonadota bacterium]|nr:septum formation initiator family protein [Gemmatimonadota bacterium]